MSAQLRKQDLEILTFLSGIVTSIASATGYFYGKYAEGYGPAATLLIILMWMILVFLTIRNNVREDQAIESDDQALPLHSSSRILDYFILGWSFTLLIWGFGIIYNWTTPQYIHIEGYVIYDNNIHLENATVEVYYANEKVIDYYTDSYGYFSIRLQREVDEDHVYIRVHDAAFYPLTDQLFFTDKQGNYSEFSISLTPKHTAP